MEPTPIEAKEQGQAIIGEDPATIGHSPGRASEDAVLEFGRFRLLLRQRQLLADGVPVELGTRAFGVLLALIEANGSLVTRDELLARAWPGIAVAPDNLKVQVAALRKALGEGRDHIRTEFGRGYRFTAVVRHSSAEGRQSLPESEMVGAPAGSDTAVPAQLAAITAQLAYLEGKLAHALQLLDERALRHAEPFHGHTHWVGFSDHANRRSRGKGAETGETRAFARSR